MGVIVTPRGGLHNFIQLEKTVSALHAAKKESPPCQQVSVVRQDADANNKASHSEAVVRELSSTIWPKLPFVVCTTASLHANFASWLNLLKQNLEPFLTVQCVAILASHWLITTPVWHLDTVSGEEESIPLQWGTFCVTRQGELRSPACLRLIEGTPQGRQTGGAFFGLPLLGKTRKVTSRRATPGNNSRLSAATPNIKPSVHIP